MSTWRTRCKVRAEVRFGEQSYTKSVSGDVASLLRALAQFDMQKEGQRLQNVFSRFLDAIRISMAEIWPESIDLSMLPGPLEDQVSRLRWYREARGNMTARLSLSADGRELDGG